MIKLFLRKGHPEFLPITVEHLSQSLIQTCFLLSRLHPHPPPTKGKTGTGKKDSATYSCAIYISAGEWLLGTFLCTA
jgi:hypothetical protein